MPKEIRCSFCGRTADEVDQMLAWPNGLYICNYCVEDAHKLLDANKKKASDPTVLDGKLPTPQQIKSFLDNYVVGRKRPKESFRCLFTTTTSGLEANFVATLLVRNLERATYFS